MSDKPDAERWRWFSAQLVAQNFDALENAFGCLTGEFTKEQLDALIDVRLQPPSKMEAV